MTKGKKNVKFQEKVTEHPADVNNPSNAAEGTKSRRFKEKHSLDSDEEFDEEEKDVASGEKNILHEDDIEGQEDETIRNDEGITLTPFNLKDELEEGHFDAQGNYIANKDEEATDQWLESVDWKKVEDRPFQMKPKPMEEEEPVLAPLKVMQDMVEIMKPGETVLKCLRRLGGNKKPISSADRWKKKKMNIHVPVDEKAEEDKKNLLKLTGLADDLLQDGDFQIYEKTYEQLKYEIKSNLSQFEDADDELEVAFKKPKLDLEAKEMEKGKLDIESDEDDDELETTFKRKSGNLKEKNELVQNLPAKNIESIYGIENTKDLKDTTVTLSDEVSWTYKLENNDKSEIIGPYTSLEMLKMQETGKFGDGVFCRKTGSEGSFYSSSRVDFDLYT